MNDIIKKFGYVIVTDYIEANSGEDASGAIQEIIENNPNKTIFSPMGNIFSKI